MTGATNGTTVIDVNGNLNYVHDGLENLFDSITYQIVDDQGLTDTATIFVNIQPVDDSPTVEDDDLGIIASGQQLIASPMILLGNDEDVDSTITADDIRIITQPAGGQVEIDSDGQLVFTPDTDFAGEAVFEYQVFVEGNFSGVAQASVEVIAPFQPTPPVVEQVEEQQVEQQEEIEEQEEEEEEQARRGRQLNNSEDDDEQIVLDSSNSNFNDYLDIGSSDPIAELKNTSIEAVLTADYTSPTYAYASRLDDLSLVNLTGTVIADAEKVSEFAATYMAGLVWDDLDSAKQNYLLNGLEIGVPTIVTSAASFLTVGYLAWIIRGGVLLTTFMSSVPAWSSFDILSVIDAAGGDDESIEQMVDH